jgi:hypothetical protein
VTVRFGALDLVRENGEGLPILLILKTQMLADDKTDLDVLAVNVQENG